MNQVVQLNVYPFMIEEFVKFTEIAPLKKAHIGINVIMCKPQAKVH